MNEFFANFSSWIWLGLMVLFIAIEAGTLALTTVWAAIAAFPMIFISRTSLAPGWQLLIFLVLTLILVIFTRPFAAKKLLAKKEQTNVNALEGQTVLVVKPILKFQKGEVKSSNGVIWSAKTDDGEELAEGAECKVILIEGNTLTVKKIAAENS